MKTLRRRGVAMIFISHALEEALNYADRISVLRNGEPRLVIFDEPTRGVDVGAVAEIHKIIRDLAAFGAGVVVISSYLPEILDVSDRILVAKSGTIAAEFARSEATPEKILQAAIQ
jgi:ABC-type sugar transport system ATPase subunit